MQDLATRDPLLAVPITSPDATITDLFERQVERCPSAVAVRCGAVAWTFDDLNRRANQIARYLRRRLGGRRSPVALCCDRGVELTAALLGTVKAGLCYVPVDPHAGATRLATIVRQAGASIVVSGGGELREGSPTDALVDLHADAAAIDGEDQSNVGIPSVPGAILNIIFTSGTTGTPKGLLVPAASVLNQLAGLWRRYPLYQSDVSLVQRSYSVIGATWDYLGPLLCGVRSVYPTPRAVNDAAEIWRLIAEEHATLLWASPGLLRGLVEHGERHGLSDPTLRLATAGGDVMPATLPERWRRVFPHARLIDSYGATECSHVAQFDATDIGPTTRRVPVGRPLAGIRVHIVGDDLQEVPDGESGTLCVAGPSLAYGYVHAPALTAARFVANPFGAAGERLYWTGDRAIRGADAVLDVQGRSDHQIKILGYRVELEEVEATIRRCDGVQAAGVIARPDERDDLRLIAFLVLDGESTASPRTIRSALLTELPPYLVPSAYVEMSRLPATSSGKIDRPALLRSTDPITYAQDIYTPPVGSIATRLADLWSEELGVSPIGFDDNFLAFGGDSLSAARMLSSVQASCGVDVPFAAFFENPTLRALAAMVAALDRAPGSAHS